MADLPKWVWDIIINLNTQEMEHPELYVRVDAKYPEQGYSYKESDWCPGRALDLVPPAVREQAKAIRDYTRQAELDKEEGDGAGQ